MPSLSFQKWDTIRSSGLDEIENAHSSVGGNARGRRYATQQINQAYAVLLSSQFQGFCRDLHSECVDSLAGAVAPATFETILHTALAQNRKLDTGNPNPGSIGSDFTAWGETPSPARIPARQRWAARSPCVVAFTFDISPRICYNIPDRSDFSRRRRVSVPSDCLPP